MGNTNGGGNAEPLPVLEIRGAREHNLRDVTLTLPRHALIVFSGLSGSGKSSLAFDTIFMEARRRYLESLPAFARQYLPATRRPNVDRLCGLSPAIAIDQKSSSESRRSTVGTITGINDYLRILYSRFGTAVCPTCGIPMEPHSIPSMCRTAQAAFPTGSTVEILAPLVLQRRGSHRRLFEELLRAGFSRVIADGTLHRLTPADPPALDPNKRHDIHLLVDRFELTEARTKRLEEAIATAVEWSGGSVTIRSASRSLLFDERGSCPSCGRGFPPLEPLLFSFNSPLGWCPVCRGSGEVPPATAALVKEVQRCLAFPAESSLPARDPYVRLITTALESILSRLDIEKPSGSELRLHPSDERRILLGDRGAGLPGLLELGGSDEDGWKAPPVTCPLCLGSRLRKECLHIRLPGGPDFVSLQAMEIGRLPEVLSEVRCNAPQKGKSALERVCAELDKRISFMEAAGLGYLTLSRSAETLSGGELQRAKLASALGAGMRGILYVLDEPSIGLHPTDTDRLLRLLRRLCDEGNTIIVVEHDLDVIGAADLVVEFGPGAGGDGGEIVACCPPERLQSLDTPTGRALKAHRGVSPRTGGMEEAGATCMESSSEGRGRLLVRGIRTHNLRGIDAAFPRGAVTVVCGVSGAGKSSLVFDTLLPLLREGYCASCDAVEGLNANDVAVVVDQSPIGRTPRSTPATFLGVFSRIRELFSSLPEAQAAGHDRSHFSFNVEGGRCRECEGTGVKKISMNFLEDIIVTCPRCNGARYEARLSVVRYRGHDIGSVLDCTASEALELFGDHPEIAEPLRLMVEMGLGYLPLGQPSPTLSGGEAQRLKLCRELRKRYPGKHVFYLLDEPTTGLHHQDVERLLEICRKLTSRGHTVVVVEHNLQVIRAADHVIELGPGGGEAGGRLLAACTPACLARMDTPTGRCLAMHR